MRVYLDPPHVPGGSSALHLIAGRTELCYYGQWYLYTGTVDGILRFANLIGGGDLTVPEDIVRESGGFIQALGARQRP